MGLEDVDPFIELLTIFFVAVGGRVFSVIVLRWMETSGEKLKELKIEETDESLRAFVKAGSASNGSANGNDNSFSIDDDDMDEVELVEMSNKL